MAGPLSGAARIVTNNSLENDVNVPAPLQLPFGKLSFGFNIQPYVPPQKSEDSLSQVNSIPVRCRLCH